MTDGARLSEQSKIDLSAQLLAAIALLSVLKLGLLPALLAGGGGVAEAAPQPAPMSAAAAPASEPELDDAQLTFQF